MHLARDRISPGQLVRPFFSLLDGEGHGPGLNAILTGRRAHHLADISLYESDNGIQASARALTLAFSAREATYVGQERERETEKRKEVLRERERERESERAIYPSCDHRSMGPSLISDWYYRSAYSRARARLSRSNSKP